MELWFSNRGDTWLTLHISLHNSDWTCFVLKDIVVCSCNMLFDFFLWDIQFCQETQGRPIDYDNITIWMFWCSSITKLNEYRSMLLSSLTVVQEGGVQGVQAHSQKLWFIENPGKFPEKSSKISENLGKISSNLGKNGAQCLTSKNAAQRLQKNKWRPFFGGRTKIRSTKVARQCFGQVWEHLGKNFLHPPKICLLLHLWSLIIYILLAEKFKAKINTNIFRFKRFIFPTVYL